MARNQVINKSIGLVLIISLVTVTTAVLFAFGYYNYATRSSRATQDLQRQAERLANRLALNLAQPMWNLNNSQAREIMASEMEVPQVQAILMEESDGGKVFEGLGRDDTWNPAPAQTPPQGAAFTAKKPVTRQGQVIGMVKTYLSGKYLQIELRELLWSQILEILLVDLGVVAILFLVIRLVVVRPVKAMQLFAREVSQGQLSCQMAPGTYLGELGELRQYLEDMVCHLAAQMNEVVRKGQEASESARQAEQARDQAQQATLRAESAKREGMRQAARQLDEVVAVLTKASTELSHQIEASSQGFDLQARRIAETATAVAQMNATVFEVAKNATQAAQTADCARDQAVGGAKVVGQVVQGMGQVQQGAINLKAEMDALGQQAQGIGQILNVISDIADQTNLLALNAAIEAARAGDAGRGFAVVADEVRKLAEKTQTATKEVGQAIAGIQDGARRNITHMDGSVVSIGQVTALAGQSGEALKQIVDLVDNTTLEVNSIATASQEQSVASEEIARSVEDVNRVSLEMSQALRQSAQAVNDLAEQAAKLARLMQSLDRQSQDQLAP